MQKLSLSLRITLPPTLPVPHPSQLACSLYAPWAPTLSSRNSAHVSQAPSGAPCGAAELGDLPGRVSSGRGKPTFQLIFLSAILRARESACVTSGPLARSVRAGRPRYLKIPCWAALSKSFCTCSRLPGARRAHLWARVRALPGLGNHPHMGDRFGAWNMMHSAIMGSRARPTPVYGRCAHAMARLNRRCSISCCS